MITVVTITVTEPTAIGDRSVTTAALVAAPTLPHALAAAVYCGTTASPALPFWPTNQIATLASVGRAARAYAALAE